MTESHIEERPYWTTWKRLGWVVATAFSALLVWQLISTEAPWMRVVSGALLGVVGVAVGLHIGSESAANYTKDLQRLNKVLADQNRELELANAMLLRQVSADPQESSKTL